MPIVPHLQLNDGVYNAHMPRGPQGPPADELARAYKLQESGRGQNGRPEWSMQVPPPVGDKGTQREQMNTKRFEENAQGRIAYRTVLFQGDSNRLAAEGYAQLNPRNGLVFFSEDAAGVRPASSQLQNAGMQQLARLKLPAPLVLQAHPSVAAEQSAQNAASLIGADQAARMPAAQAPTGQRLSPQQALVQSKLGG